MSGCRRTQVLSIAAGMACLSAAGALSLAENVGFVSANGTGFEVNECPVRIVGTNNYYQMIHRRGADSAGVDEVPEEMAARGMNVLRTWAFQDLIERGDCLQCAPAAQLGSGEAPTDFIDEETFVGLDELLAKCDALGIRVILTLVNNWDDFGGMNRYTLWRFGVEDHDAFFTDSIIRDWFKDYASALVHRVNTVNGRVYRDDPTIFAWELANEPRASGSGSAADLDAWIADISGYIKSVDPNHMVTTGLEGFYGPGHANRNTDGWMASQGTDFIDNHAHASIDFATFHVWPQNWGWNPIGATAFAKTKATTYVARHLEDATDTIGKPVVIAEFGLPRDSHGAGPGSGTTTVRDEFFEDVFHALCENAAATNEGCAGTLNWIVFDTASAAYDDGNGVFLPEDATTDSILTSHAAALVVGATPDCNGNGVPDECDAPSLEDVALFIDILLSGPPDAYAGCIFDQNEDGQVDGRDIQLFINGMIGP